MRNNNKKEEKSNSEKFWIFMLVCAMIFGHYITYISISSTADMKSEKTYCGVVAYKSAEEVPIKHGTETELYLGVDFEEIGRKAIEVDVDTYFSNKKGDTVCLSLNKKQAGTWNKTSWEELSIMAGLLIGSFVVVADIVFLCIFGDEIIKRFNKMLDGK